MCTELSIKKLRVDHTYRAEPEDPAQWAAFLASVEANAVMVPLLCQRNGRGFLVLDGRRRLRAAVECELDTVPVRVLAGDARTIELAGNVARKQMSPMETVRALRDLRDRLGITGKEVADLVGYRPMQVSKYKTLEEADPDEQAALDAGEITMTEVVQRIRGRRAKADAAAGRATTKYGRCAIAHVMPPPPPLSRLHVRGCRPESPAMLEIVFALEPRDPCAEKIRMYGQALIDGAEAIGAAVENAKGRVRLSWKEAAK